MGGGNFSILIGALLTAIPPLFGQSGRLHIRVTDITGAVIPRAAISTSRTPATIITDKSGEAVLTDLPLGDCRISIRVPGFQILEKTVIIQGGEHRLDATLELGSMIPDVVSVTTSPGETTTGFVPSPQILDLPSPRATAPKRHWWQIFR